MIGRTKEKEILRKAYHSTKPELVALVGRKRVGKTYLVRQFFQGKIDFEVVGLQEENKEKQLRNFAYSLRDAKGETILGKVPIDWLEAFDQLKLYIQSLGEPDRKKVVFIDELPWMSTPRSDFLTGFGYFWNSFASKYPIVVVICGSATAWMIKKIINNNKGLHNRVTRKIQMFPFSLSEVEAYFRAKNMNFERYQILLFFMAMGGIPHYLEQIERGKSAVQNINSICFEPLGLLRTEFDNLYTSLFKNPTRYEAVVTALASTWKGLSRQAILEKLKIKDGGGLTEVLEDLEQSGFIASYIPFNKKKKNMLYRLIDNYSLFYLKFIQSIPRNQTENWTMLSQTQSWKSWSGYAFENICLQHIDKIKAALGITGVYTKQFSFLSKASAKTEG
ncbi:MAG: ATP-binding protein [Chitinophagales bacterium]